VATDVVAPTLGLENDIVVSPIQGGPVSYLPSVALVLIEATAVVAPAHGGVLPPPLRVEAPIPLLQHLVPLVVSVAVQDKV
jgi:hypothetical protein